MKKNSIMFSSINKQSLNTWAMSMYEFVVTFLRSREFENFLDTCKILLEKIYNLLPSIDSITLFFEKNIVENILTPNEISYAKEKFDVTKKNANPALHTLYKKAGSLFFSYVYNDKEKAFSFDLANETVASKDVPPILTPDEISRMKEKFETTKKNITHASHALYTQMTSFLSTYGNDTEKEASPSSSMNDHPFLKKTVPPLVKKGTAVEPITEPLIIKQSIPSVSPTAIEYSKASFCQSFPKYEKVVNDIHFEQRKDPKEENICFVELSIYHMQQRPKGCNQSFHIPRGREQKIPHDSLFIVNPELCPDPKLSKLSFRLVKNENTSSGFAINIIPPLKKLVIEENKRTFSSSISR